MSLYNNVEKQKIIMDRYSHPEFKSNIKDPMIKVFSNRCVDQIFLNYKIENDVLNDISFDGKGCAVFLASTDIVIGKVINQKISYIKNFLNEYLKAINNEKYDEKLLEEAGIFDYVKKHLNRYECAIMIYNALQEMLEKI